MAEIITDQNGKMHEVASNANGVSYENLLKMSNVNNLKYRFRRIREFVRCNFSREE